ncbi:uncharacterized protein PITG_17627 [Phytophthora infestans T30-4]|uniref:Tudor domain-containing protein n=1 Tax=Phytophthora infestans (strain T30-4) TaxID=403677 RepID=D0NWT9_PHYIT|nr:uncharacterized protein PITG_17627 [Phytophthora infestans T30-4]EEY67522.1 conserved hypothetical protein [Phytophthora infestans T30-4]|eukprot:XP_002896495.1 conserved hypothetical protein [Phytophthora infestans T30-4]
MKMETLAYLARSDSSDSDDSSDGSPTPLDPEYWRGITHSREVAPARSSSYRHPSRVETPSSHHYDHRNYAPATYPMYDQNPHQRPMTSPNVMMQSHGVYTGPSARLSPINYQIGSPICPVSHMDAMLEGSYMPHSGGTMLHGGGAVMQRSAGWSRSQPRNYPTSVPPASTPQHLKLQIREALVRAQAYLDLVPFFQSYDLSYAGGVRLGVIQEALARMGVILGDQVLQSIGQLFNVPGSGLVDYVAFGRFLELDRQELDNMRSVVATRRSVLANSGIELGDLFAQYDSHHTGFVPRSTFATLLHDYSIIIPETTLHFLMIELAKPSDTTCVSYVRFLEMTDVGVARANPPHSRTMENFPLHFSSLGGHRSDPFAHESPARGYEVQTAVPVATQATRVVDHASTSSDFATPLPRLGWVCRVCAHQQIADWATHCEICETSKPRPGLRGEGYIKCLLCKFDNNYDVDECEMCGRPLNSSSKKLSKAADKKRRSKKRYVSSSSSSSSSSWSSSSSPSDRRRTRRRKSEKRSRSSRSTQKKEEKKPRFQRGEEIQAIPLGERGYEIGVIARVRPNGTYDIEFDSGLYEKNVEESCIIELSRSRVIKARDVSDGEETKKQPKMTESDEERDPGYEPGDRVEARFQGRARFFAGVIKKCRTNGLYDIEYDDGEVEVRVRPKYIKPEEAKKQHTLPPKEDAVKVSWEKGQRVEAKLRGHADYVKCIVFRAHDDGSCDLEAENGELLKRIPGDNLRKRASSPVKKPILVNDDESIRPKRPLVKRPSELSASDDSSAQPNVRFKQGQTIEAKRNGQPIEAQYKGKSKFYPGVISRCRLNGTYDIDYDDGEKETGVAAELIRLLGKKGGGDSDDDPKQKKFREGDKVEAQYKGKSKFYPGVISRCRLNGTYDIDYDDGEKETGVAAELIRLLGKKGGGDSDDDPKQKKFREGDKVEAQYKGKSKFYPGVISRCRLNGTYDIDYDDGEKETGVAAELIRLLGKKGGGDSDDDPKQKKFREGDKVEAQYKGKSKFYPGVISRCRLNGTYDIDYDDGEKETGVAAELIRLLGKKGGGDSDDDPKQKKFREGDKVEAQYKGKRKFYPGVISRCRLNGTWIKIVEWSTKTITSSWFSC